MVFTEEERRERKNEYNRKRYQENKEKVKEIIRKSYEKHKEKRREYDKEYSKEYRKTDAFKKSHRISQWKYSGVECEDFESLYEFYINCKNCEECNIELTVDKVTTKTTRCLDHEHTTGLFRNVLCHSCNTKRR